MTVIHTIPNCPWCLRAKALLDALNMEYEEIQGKHPDWPTAPAIVVDGILIGGFTELARHVRTKC